MEHLKAVEKNHGIVDPKLEKFYANKCPASMAGYYFSWLALHKRRTYTEAGPNPLTFPEIKAWKELMEENITSYGVEVICSIDELYLKYQMENMKEKLRK